MAKTDRLSQYLDNDVLLWKDKKRYLGLPISFTTYSFDNNRLYIRKGLINTTEDEILLYRILDVTIRRTLGQKIFGVGSIILNTADQTSPVIEIKNIKKTTTTCNTGYNTGCSWNWNCFGGWNCFSSCSPCKTSCFSWCY